MAAFIVLWDDPGDGTVGSSSERLVAGRLNFEDLSLFLQKGCQEMAFILKVRPVNNLRRTNRGT